MAKRVPKGILLQNETKTGSFFDTALLQIDTVEAVLLNNRFDYFREIAPSYREFYYFANT